MPQKFRIGIMKTSLHGTVSKQLDYIVNNATQQIRERLTDHLQLDVEIFEFTESQLIANKSNYSPLDLLQIGLSEKTTRNIHFLLMIFEADLATSHRSFRIFLPSKLTNIGLLSIKRLNPKFWGYADDTAKTTQRLTNLMLHTLGHILELGHETDSQNIMYALQSIDALDSMHHITEMQIDQMNNMIPLEAHEEVSNKNDLGFILRHILSNLRIIFETVTEAKPFTLVFQLSTLMTAALSVIIILFFTAEIWDIAGTLQFAPLILFSAIALASSTSMFYSSIKIGSNHRQNRLGESRVIIVVATVITLLLVNLLLYCIFFSLSLISALLMFPEELKITWSTTDPANTMIAQIKLGMFLATMGVLTGSLGGRADSEAIVHNVLFHDDGI